MSNDNIAGRRIGHLIAAYAYDWWNGVEGIDAAVTAELDQLVTQHARAKEGQAASLRSRASRTSQLGKPLAEYAGTYVNDLIGTMEVKPEADTLAVRVGLLRALATPFTEKETIRVELMPGQGETITFVAGADGRVDSLNYGGSKFSRVK